MLNIALIQMNVDSDKRINIKTASQKVREASEMGADFVALPEMFCCPYTNASFVSNKEKEGGYIWQSLQSFASDNGVYLIGGSMPEEADGKIYNTCFVFSPEGEQIARHRKVHLFDIDVKGGQRFFESDTFTAGNEMTVVDTRHGRIGVEICFDIRFEELTRLMALDGAEIIFVPAAFNMTTGPAHWETHFKGRALDNQIFMCACAPARDMSGEYVSYGNSLITSPWGEVVCRLDEKEGILFHSIDTAEMYRIRDQIPIMKNRRKDLYEIKLL